MRLNLKDILVFKAFTLTELIVGTAILVIITGLLFTLLLGMLDISELGSTESRVQQEARQAMEIMTSELKSSDRTKIVLPAGPSYSPTISFYLPTDLDGDGTIIAAATGNIEWNPTVYTYSIVSGPMGISQLRRTGGGQPDKVLANYVVSVLFADHNIDANLALDEARIILKVRKNVPKKQRPFEVELNGVVKLRN
ncbi:MAG: hypothetical protein V1674_04520 [Candidatus Omnitrophota bacterium]